jgi:hypothetical protein
MICSSSNQKTAFSGRARNFQMICSSSNQNTTFSGRTGNFQMICSQSNQKNYIQWYSQELAADLFIIKPRNCIQWWSQELFRVHHLQGCCKVASGRVVQVCITASEQRLMELIQWRTYNIKWIHQCYNFLKKKNEDEVQDTTHIHTAQQPKWQYDTKRGPRSKSFTTNTNGAD